MRHYRSMGEAVGAAMAHNARLAASATRPEQIGFPTVQGHCPACGRTSLFLGSGGYITCARIDCPEPDAASTLLERRNATEGAR
ncbi:DUF6085 family protein [Streptomyces rubiginosohelvolus]|uniref:DUF6085 family protein n=1 Tax=Streptomyces rubiginosohelvolus TaxID=67362 RepID=UPI00369D5FAE